MKRSKQISDILAFYEEEEEEKEKEGIVDDKMIMNRRILRLV